MLKSLLLYFILVLGFLSCDKTSPISNNNTQTSYKPAIIEPYLFNEYKLFNLSFPIWFNAQLIVESEIEKIVLENITINSDNDGTIENLNYDFHYTFNSKGVVKNIVYHEYYMNKEIFNVIFSYHQNIDSLGYSLPKYSTSFKENHFLDKFNILEFDKQNNQLLQYVNRGASSNNTHYFILNKENQNTLFIDNLETDENDVFYFGTPINYSKAFELVDLVNEKKIEEVTFEKNKRVAMSIFNQLGLTLKRTHLYSNIGQWTGYVDSTFLDQNMVEVRHNIITYDSCGLPVALSTFSNNQAQLIKKIKFSYQLKAAE